MDNWLRKRKMTFWNWIKNHVAAILVPIISGAIALVISYGTNIAEETNLNNRVNSNASAIAEIRGDMRMLENEIEEIEDLLRDEVRSTENLIIREGRDLERRLIRLDARLDSIARRMAILDGIGPPSGTGFSPTPLPDVVMPEDMMPLETE